MIDYSEENESLMVFPCDFPLKVFGLADEAFESAALVIIHKHFPNLSDGSIQTRKSSNGKYLALSVALRADSKQQLDELYRELTTSPYVLMAL